MAAKRKVDNLMALAVLATVVQQPMHRYEIASLMRARGKDQDMDVKWGSLYTVVQNLAKHGFLEVVGTSRQGARPERTIYQITEAGRREMLDWTRELLSTPQPEHPNFAAGLSVQMILSPDEVIAPPAGPARQAGGVDRRPSCCDHRVSQGSSPPVPGRGRVRRCDG
jgi:DNA-binding PadR family transcriptional regulator